MGDSIFDVIDRRFMSGNSVCVERVHIKSEEWTDLKYELFSAREENERVRQANLDVMMHFEDMKATKEKLEADLDRALAMVAELSEKADALSYSIVHSLTDKQQEPFTKQFAELQDAIAAQSSYPFTLRKQAEAVDDVIDYCEQVQYGECPRAVEVKTIASYAARLRHQADQQENTHD